MVHNSVEVEINGKQVGFKCGMLAIGIACRESGATSIQDFLNRIVNQDLISLLALFYGSACQFSGKKAPELTMDMVSDWMEEMGEENARKVTNVLLEYFKPKNDKAPKVGANQ